MRVQSVLISRDKPYKWASKWVTDHGYIIKKVDDTEHYWRFRQESPKHFKVMRAKKLNENIILILGL